MPASRFTAPAALLIALAFAPPAAAQPQACPEPGLGPPVACVNPESTPGTTVPEEPGETEPGPALWVGAVFGVSGLAGIALATARVRDRGPENPR